MFFSTKSMQELSFDLYHSELDKNESSWVRNFERNIDFDNVYNSLDFGKCQIKGIRMVPKIELKKFLFWTRAIPTYSIHFAVAHRSQGMSSITSVESSKFLKSLISYELFKGKLDGIILKEM